MKVTRIGAFALFSLFGFGVLAACWRVDEPHQCSLSVNVPNHGGQCTVVVGDSTYRWVYDSPNDPLGRVNRIIGDGGDPIRTEKSPRRSACFAPPRWLGRSWTAWIRLNGECRI